VKTSRLPLIAMLAACAPLLAACGGGGEQKALRPPCPAGRLCLEYGNSGEPTTLDPQKANASWEFGIVSDFMVGLTDNDAAAKTIPGMATHWEQSPDGLVWTFHLRDGQWSDGTPVTAADFVFGLQRLFDPKTASGQAAQFYAIKNSRAVNGGKLPLSALGVTAPDAHTVRIELEHPWPILADNAAAPPMSPSPRHVVAKWGDAWSQPAHFVGNGPYLPKSWTLGDKVVVEKNPRYFDAAKVCLDRISFYPTTDAVSAERRVKRGELDLNTVVQSNRVNFLRRPDQMPGYVRVYPYVGAVFLTFNLKSVPALRDVRVRQALSMAIDRDFIVNKLFRGGQKPAYSFLPPGMLDYDGRARTYWATWPLERRQAEARRLLAAAGYGPKHPLKLEIRHRNTADPTLYTPAVQADWRSIGVKAQLLSTEVQIAYQSYEAGDFEVADAGWGGGSDAMGFLFLQRSDTGSQNYGGYKNLRYDALLDAADHERDLKRRMAYLGQAEQIVLDDAPIAPVYTIASKNLVNPNVTGWVDNNFDTHKLRFLCFRDAAQRRAGRG
jgi:oligopeptide transport system substrate-binding protein